jgi:hypothetical protein
MAEIIKKIENLKPGKNYIFSVRTKNTDINAYSESVDSILVSIPKDTTIPDAISNLALYASFENVMFVFDFSNDLDIDKYEYELYDNGAGTGTPTSTGFSSANVFTVAVPNSTDTVAKSYWGRVRSVDTTGNLGPWTALTQTDQSTPLIDNQYINSLTASKITAGIIGAQTITLSGANSILKSNNYAAANTTFGGTGWKISGDGKAVFNDASIRSSLDIGEDQGTSDATSFHVDSNGNMWSGSNSTSFSIAPFRVTNTGDVTANSLTLTGLTELATGGKIFLGAGNYNNMDTAFYVDATEQFSLGDKLTWDGNSLTVQGTLKLSDGSDVLDAEEAANIAQDLVDEFGNTIYEDGFIGGLTVTSNTMYYGTGTFASGSTAFFVGKNSGGQANFSLGDKLTWDGATLSITGNVAITGGTTYTTIQNAYDEANSASSTAIDAYGIAISAQSDANEAYALASTKITAGEIQVSIDNGTTIISGDRITTGTINADLITAGTLTGRSIVGGTININNEFRVDGSGSMFGRNVTIDADFRYRCAGIFNSTTSTTLARVHNPGGAEALCSAASKREYKYNIEDITDALSILQTVRPRIFNWKMDAFDKVDYWTNEPWSDEAKSLNEFNKSYGFIAEEMAEDQPLLTVYEMPDPDLPRDQPGGLFDLSAWTPKMWKEMDFIPLLVKAVQELSAKVEELESRLNS